MSKKKKVNRALVSSIVTSVSLLGASAGIVFGISAGMFKTEYMNLNSAEARVNAAMTNNYYNQAIKSQWDMLTNPSECSNYRAAMPTTKEISRDDWDRLHKFGSEHVPMFNESSSSAPNVDLGKNYAKGDTLPEDIEANRRHYVSMVLDGSAHAALDHSFNQSLYQGLLNYVKNADSVKIQSDNDVTVYKPGQDTNPFFQDIYRTAARNSRIVGLPGFIHVSPMETIGEFDKETGLYNFNNALLDQTGFILIDGDIPNNQNVASVLFRSDQPAFLAGLSTCMYFLHNLSVYHENYKPLAVATYGGAAIPTVVIYMGGYERGVEFFNEFVLKGIIRDMRNALDGKTTWNEDSIYAQLFEFSQYKEQLQEWKDAPEEIQEKIRNKLINPDDYSGFLYDEFEVKVIKLGDFSTHFTGTFTAGDAIGITKQLINRGASAILPVAGSQTIDTSQEVQNQDSSCIVLGVDAVMEDGDDQRALKKEDYYDRTVALDGSVSLQAKNHLKFSACKDMASVVDNISRLAMNNLNWDVDGQPWEHTYVSDYSEEKTITLDATNTTFATDLASHTAKVEQLLINDLSGKESIIVPATVLIDGVEYSINGVLSRAFDQRCANIKSFKFESQVDFSFASEAFFGPESVNFELEHIDFSACNPSINIETQTGQTFNFHVQSKKCKGVYSFNSNVSESNKSILANNLSSGFPEAVLDNWLSKEHPNPNKSICNIGFKTCGNIQNGMISVSFDGLYYLMEALLQVDDIEHLDSFKNIWGDCARSYVESHPELNTTEFRENVITNAFKRVEDGWYEAGNTGLLTFRRYIDEAKTRPTTVYANYTHIMNILGMTFNEWKLDFKPYMTIQAGTAAAPAVAQETQNMSVNDWLDLNMYFTC